MTHFNKFTDSLNRSLTDLRISVTDKCNFRCMYCMPSSSFNKKNYLKKNKILTFREITKIVNILTHMGLKKIRLTGGEPLLRTNLYKLINLLKKKNKNIAITLTTNAFLLTHYAKKLKQAGLDRLTVSLSSLYDIIFNKINGKRSSVSSILESIFIAEKIGFFNLRINIAIIYDINDNEILSISSFFKNSGHILRFIEYMDVGNQNNWNIKKVIPTQFIINTIHKKTKIFPLFKKNSTEVAKRYGYLDGSGEVGFISSIFEAFCKNCTRLRLSANGKLYTCLFSLYGFDFKNILKSIQNDYNILLWLKKIWNNRTDQYSLNRFSKKNNNSVKIEMYQIGG